MGLNLKEWLAAVKKGGGPTSDPPDPNYRPDPRVMALDPTVQPVAEPSGLVDALLQFMMAASNSVLAYAVRTVVFLPEPTFSRAGPMTLTGHVRSVRINADFGGATPLTQHDVDDLTDGFSFSGAHVVRAVVAGFHFVDGAHTHDGKGRMRTIIDVTLGGP